MQWEMGVWVWEISCQLEHLCPILVTFVHFGRGSVSEGLSGNHQNIVNYTTYEGCPS